MKVEINKKLESMFFGWLKEQPLAPYPVMFYDIPFNTAYSYLEDFLESIYIFVYIEYHEHIKQYSGKIKNLHNNKRVDLGVFKSKNDARLDVISAANKIIR